MAPELGWSLPETAKREWGRDPGMQTLGLPRNEVPACSSIGRIGRSGDGSCDKGVTLSFAHLKESPPQVHLSALASIRQGYPEQQGR